MREEKEEEWEVRQEKEEREMSEESSSLLCSIRLQFRTKPSFVTARVAKGRKVSGKFPESFRKVSTGILAREFWEF